MFAATSGYRNDGDAGLMHVGARYYDAQVGLFITRDTELDQKPYLYCHHDPVNYLDPTGHWGWDWHQYWKDMQDVAKREIELGGGMMGLGTAGSGIAGAAKRTGGKWVKPVTAAGGVIWVVGEVFYKISEIGKDHTR